MSQATKVLLLIASFLPVLAAHVFAFLLLSQQAGERSWLDGHFGQLVFALAAFQFGIAAFFTWHLKNRSSAPKEQHRDWMLQFFFLPSPLGVVSYWYKHIWRANGHAL
ncbi:hypothetical protein [Lysobacter solisilvae (ex Woo and Kim 2020)]|uniref:Uncharacterized protein n=1 Tax=Agrilutibacter terrestris TaxID=2865112 RepID=A0A7H0FVY0_9GAMM|nr:hypothetical protein [Lysobacter terrestris]QNP40196.1 hypothetical protein H8B22_11965 [Lysobacter terrestris]